MSGFLMTVFTKAAIALAEAIVVRLARDLWRAYTGSRSTAVPQAA